MQLPCNHLGTTCYTCQLTSAGQACQLLLEVLEAVSRLASLGIPPELGISTDALGLLPLSVPSRLVVCLTCEV